MLTGLLIILPLVASLLVFLTKGGTARTLAMAAAVVEFALSVFVYFQFKTNPAAAAFN